MRAASITKLPAPVFTGLISLYLLKITISDFQEEGPANLWPFISAIFFLTSVFYFVKTIRQNSD
jgi:hypothetical protein